MRKWVVEMLALAALTGAAARGGDASLAAEGNRLYAGKKYEEALKMYDRALENAAPENRAALLFNRADALYRLGKLKEAAEAWREAAAADAALGRDSAYNQGNAARDMAQTLKESDPKAALDALLKSEAQYRRALEHAPGDPDSAHNLDLVRREIRQLREQLPPPSQQPRNGKDQQNKQDQQDQQNKQERNQDQQQPADQDKRQENQKQDQKQNQSEQPQDESRQADQRQSSDDSRQDQRQEDKKQDGKEKEEKEDRRSGKDSQEKKQEPQSGKDGENQQENQQENQKEEPRDAREKNEQPSGEGTPKQQETRPAPRDTPEAKEDARTADQFLQREKEDRERRHRRHLRQAPVERDW